MFINVKRGLWYIKWWEKHVIKWYVHCICLGNILEGNISRNYKCLLLCGWGYGYFYFLFFARLLFSAIMSIAIEIRKIRYFKL